MKASAPSTRANSAESGGALHGGKAKPLSFEALSKSISSFWDKTRTESGSVSFLMGAVDILSPLRGWNERVWLSVIDRSRSENSEVVT